MKRGVRVLTAHIGFSVKSSYHAAGSAAAIVCAIAAVAVARPSQALQTEASPLPARYTDHASAMVQLASASFGAAQPIAETPAPVTDFSSPAIAPVLAHTDAQIAETPDAEPEPEAAGKQSLAGLVEAHDDTETLDAEHDCLARAVYFESKGEPLEGQLAVAEVIINRAASGRFPTTLCGVVKQRSQFSFVRGGAIPAVPRTAAAWRKAVAIATIARDDLAESRTPDAMFFHARRVAPGWRNVRRIASIGNHVFYR